MENNPFMFETTNQTTIGGGSGGSGSGSGSPYHVYLKWTTAS